MTYILPADNAVIDYSIMSQIINAINTIDGQVQTLVKNQQSSNSSGGGTVTALNKTIGGKIDVPANAKEVSVYINDIANIQSVVGILHLPNSTTPIACSLKVVGKKSTFVFLPSKTATTLYWIAYGTN